MKHFRGVQYWPGSTVLSWFTQPLADIPFTPAIASYSTSDDGHRSSWAAFPGPSYYSHRQAHAGTVQLLPFLRDNAPSGGKGRNRKRKIMPTDSACSCCMCVDVSPLQCIKLTWLKMCVSYMCQKICLFWTLGSLCRMCLTGLTFGEAHPTQKPLWCWSHPVHQRWPELLAQLHRHRFSTKEKQHNPHHWVYAILLYIFLKLLYRYCIQ